MLTFALVADLMTVVVGPLELVGVREAAGAPDAAAAEGCAICLITAGGGV